MEGIVGNKSGAFVSVIPIIITVAPPALPHVEGFFGYQCLVNVLTDGQHRFCLDAIQSNSIQSIATTVCSSTCFGVHLMFVCLTTLTRTKTLKHITAYEKRKKAHHSTQKKTQQSNHCSLFVCVRCVWLHSFSFRFGSFLFCFFLFRFSSFCSAFSSLSLLFVLLFPFSSHPIS